MIPLQIKLVAWLSSFPGVVAFMHTRWAWPLAESAHFIGLTVLLGSIAAWDLRLIGWFKNVPVAAFHKLVPWAVVGFAINAATGPLFLMAQPDQYIYNPAFQLKVMCLILAGANIALFYVLSFRTITILGPAQQAPMIARLGGALSLALWIAVIVCGRMIAFFKPGGCEPGEALGLLAQCIVR